MKTLTPVLLLALVVACGTGSRNRASRQSEWPEGESPMTVHPKIEKWIRMGNMDVGRRDDGRMEVRMAIANRSKKPITVLAYTDWVDADGNVLERSNDVPMVIPSGTTKLYEDVSWSSKVERFSVSVRPANTVRRTR